MIIKGLSKEEAKNKMAEWLQTKTSLSLAPEYEEIRKFIADLYEKTITSIPDDDNRRLYVLDVCVGINLYKFFSEKDWFTLRVASDDTFWSYLSVVVNPDVVAARWGETNETHFWKQSNRIWLKTLWWYVYITFNRDLDFTKEMLLLPIFNSDNIQALVERTGKKGTYIDVYRAIALKYSNVSPNNVLKYKKKMTGTSDNFFRAVMKLNTARTMVVNPCLCQGGPSGYADSLINDILETIK